MLFPPKVVRFARWCLVEHDAYDEGGIIAATGPFNNALLPLQFHAMCQTVHVPTRSLPVTRKRGSINNPLGLPTPPLHLCTTAVEMPAESETAFMCPSHS